MSALLLSAAFFGGTLVNTPLRDAVRNSEKDVVATWSVETRSVTPQTEPIEGTVHPGSKIEMSAGAVSDTDAVRQVVTATRAKVGDRIGSGDIPIFVSARPLILLDLRIPFYRDLHPGDTGDDVRDLQRALKALGLFGGAVDGDYGPLTASAVERLYVTRGSAPPPVPEDKLEAVRNLEDELEQAKSEVARMTDEIVNAPSDGEMAPDAKLGASAPSNEQRQSSADRADELTQYRATAQGAVAEIEVQLSKARLAALTWLPQSEILAVPTGASAVLSIQEQGTILSPESGPLISLSTGTPYVEARVRVDQADGFQTGTKVTVATVGDESKPIEGNVQNVGTFSDGSELTEPNGFPGYNLKIAIKAEDIPPGDETVLIRPKHEAKEVTGPAVPLTALRHDSEGSYVLVADDTAGQDPDPRRVAVSTSLQSGGFAILNDGGDLMTGMTVILEGSG